MIYDSVDNLKTYREIHALTKVIDYIQANDLCKLAVGKYEIDGDRLYLMIQEYVTKNPEDARVETHERYIDVQIMLDGMEYMGYAPRSACGDPVETRPDEDFWFYDTEVRYYEMANNTCMILFPHDAHQPQVRYQENRKVHKAVFKVHV